MICLLLNTGVLVGERRCGSFWSSFVGVFPAERDLRTGLKWTFEVFKLNMSDLKGEFQFTQMSIYKVFNPCIGTKNLSKNVKFLGK